MGWTAFCTHVVTRVTLIERLRICSRNRESSKSFASWVYTLMLAAIGGKGKIVASLIEYSQRDARYINQVAIGSYGYPVSALNFACRYNTEDRDVQMRYAKGGRTSAIIHLIDAGARTNDIDQATEGLGGIAAASNVVMISQCSTITSGAETDLHMQPVGSSTQQSYPVDILYEKIHSTGMFDNMPAATPEISKEWEVFHEVLFFPGRVEDTSGKCFSNPSLMYRAF